MQNLENTSSPQSEANASLPTDALRLIPSSYFFYEIVEIDSELSTEERADFIQLQIETLSPFPIEQIFHGYFIIPNTHYCVLYAALKDRLLSSGFETLNTYTWVLPHFILELTAKAPLLLSVSAIKELVLKSTSDNYSIEVQKEGALHIQKSGDSSDEAFTLTADQLWIADIRSLDFKEQAKRDRSRLAFLSKAFQYSLYFAAFLLIAELALIAASGWLSAYASKIEKQATAVSRIEDQHTLINKLDQIAQNELRPIALLERANEIRTRSGSNIIYDDVDIIGENEVTIKGTAGSVNQFNAYVNQLKRSGYFVISEDPKYVTRGGKTTFTLKMNYQHSKLLNP